METEAQWSNWSRDSQLSNRARLPGWFRQERICLRCRRLGFEPWVGKIPWRRKWLPTPVFLPGKSHGQRILMGYCSWGCKVSDMTEAIFTSLHLKWHSPAPYLLNCAPHVSSVNDDYDYFPNFYKENVYFYNKALISLFNKLPARLEGSHLPHRN